MTPLGKYIWLIKLLQESDGLTFEEINEAWLKSRRHTEDENMPILKRTFHNHIKAIRDEYGINIECGKGYKYYIVDHDKDVLPKVGHLSQLDMLSEIVNDSKLRRNLFVDDSNGFFREQNIITIMDAIKTRRKICMPDIRFSFDGGHLTLNVAPYQLHYICLQWYLIGHTDEFGLMRIPLSFSSKVSITEESYKPQHSPEEYSKMIYGISTERLQLSILICDSFLEKSYFYRYPLMPFQQKVEYGSWIKEGEKYNFRLSFEIPKAPFALCILQKKLSSHIFYAIENDFDPFELFTKEKYDDEEFYSVVL